MTTKEVVPRLNEELARAQHLIESISGPGGPPTSESRPAPVGTEAKRMIRNMLASEKTEIADFRGRREPAVGSGDKGPGPRFTRIGEDENGHSGETEKNQSGF